MDSDREFVPWHSLKDGGSWDSVDEEWKHPRDRESRSQKVVEQYGYSPANDDFQNTVQIHDGSSRRESEHKKGTETSSIVKRPSDGYSTKLTIIGTCPSTNQRARPADTTPRTAVETPMTGSNSPFTCSPSPPTTATDYANHHYAHYPDPDDEDYVDSPMKAIFNMKIRTNDSEEASFSEIVPRAASEESSKRKHQVPLHTAMDEDDTDLIFSPTTSGSSRNSYDTPTIHYFSNRNFTFRNWNKGPMMFQNRWPDFRARMWILVAFLFGLVLTIILLSLHGAGKLTTNKEQYDANLWPETAPIAVPIDDVTMFPTGVPTLPPKLRPTTKPTKHKSTTTEAPNAAGAAASANTKEPTVGQANLITPETDVTPFFPIITQITSKDSLVDLDSPQRQAILWMAEQDSSLAQGTLTMDDTNAILQRYAMRVLDVGLHLPSQPVWSESDTHECLWEGVTCNEHQEVVEINWARQELTGSLMPEISALKSLSKLDLAQNGIQGTLDPIYQLENIEEIYLFENDLTGNLKKNLRWCQNLTKFMVGHNKLTGSLPGMRLRHMRWFNVQANLLSGTIPPDLKLPLAFSFDISYNNINGTIPASLNDVTIPNIRILDLNNNQLTGSIPDNFVSLGAGKTRRVDLSFNKLQGQFPAWKTLDFLNILDLRNNDFPNKLDNLCQMSVFEYGELVELRADCDICNCKYVCRTCDDEVNGYTYEYDTTWQFDDDEVTLGDDDKAMGGPGPGGRGPVQAGPGGGPNQAGVDARKNGKAGKRDLLEEWEDSNDDDNEWNRYDTVNDDGANQQVRTAVTFG